MTGSARQLGSVGAVVLLLGCRPVVPPATRPPTEAAAEQEALVRSAQPVCQLAEPRFYSFELRPGDPRSEVSRSGVKQLELLRDAPYARVQSEDGGLLLRGFLKVAGLELSVRQPITIGGFLLTRGPVRILAVRSAEQIEVELIEAPALVQPAAPLRTVLRCADLTGDTPEWSSAAELQLAGPGVLAEKGAAPAAPAGPWYLWGPVKSRQQLVEFWDKPIDRIRDARWERTHKIEVPLSLTPSGPPVAVLRGWVRQVEVLAARDGFRLITLEEQKALVFGWVPDGELQQLDAPLAHLPSEEDSAQGPAKDLPLHLGTGRGHSGAGLGFGYSGYGRSRYAPRPRPLDPRVEFDQVEVQGALADRQRSVAAGVTFARKQVLACFTQELQRRPLFEAELQLDLAVEPSGVVRTSELKDPKPGSPEVERCVAQALQQHARLPRAAAASTVRVFMSLELYGSQRYLSAWSCPHDVPISVKGGGTYLVAGILRARTYFEAEPVAGAAMIPLKLLHTPIDSGPDEELVLPSEFLKDCRRLRDQRDGR